MKSSLALILVFALTSMGNCDDTLVYEFSGVVPLDARNHFRVNGGETWIARFTIDISVPDDVPDDPMVGVYTGSVNSAIIEFSGGYSKQFDTTGWVTIVSNDRGNGVPFDAISIRDDRFNQQTLNVQVLRESTEALFDDSLPEAGVAFASQSTSTVNYYQLQFWDPICDGFVVYATNDEENTEFSSYIRSTNSSPNIIVTDQLASDIAYSSDDHMIYVSVPSASQLNPNSLITINPDTGEFGEPIAIGFNPQAVAMSLDGTTSYTVLGDGVGIQPFDVPSQTLGSPFFINGPLVKQILPIPDRPDAVLVSTHLPQYSPPATGTAVWENGIRLPNVVGTGLLNGGPDLIAVDPEDGTKGYGYQNTVSSFSNWNLEIDTNGVSGDGPSLQGVLVGFGIQHIERYDGRIYTDQGDVYNIDPPFQYGAFVAGREFILDPPTNRLFSISSFLNTHTIRAYDLTTLQLLGTELVTDVSGTARSLTRFGDSGIAFRTTLNQIVLVGEPQLRVPLAVPGDSFEVTRGTLGSGGIEELEASDNLDLSIRRNTSDTQSRTEFEIRAVGPVASPSTMEVTLEGSVFGRTQVDQTIELFDYAAGVWEEVDTREATRFTDSVVTVAATGDLSRFVETGTMCVKARIRYQSISPRQRFSSNTDQFFWTITP